jgi:hypothetical protein
MHSHLRTAAWRDKSMDAQWSEICPRKEHLSTCSSHRCHLDDNDVKEIIRINNSIFIRLLTMNYVARLIQFVSRSSSSSHLLTRTSTCCLARQKPTIAINAPKSTLELFSKNKSHFSSKTLSRLFLACARYLGELYFFDAAWALPPGSSV